MSAMPYVLCSFVVFWSMAVQLKVLVFVNLTSSNNSKEQRRQQHCVSTIMSFVTSIIMQLVLRNMLTILITAVLRSSRQLVPTSSHHCQFHQLRHHQQHHCPHALKPHYLRGRHQCHRRRREDHQSQASNGDLSQGASCN